MTSEWRSDCFLCDQIKTVVTAGAINRYTYCTACCVYGPNHKSDAEAIAKHEQILAKVRGVDHIPDATKMVQPDTLTARETVALKIYLEIARNQVETEDAEDEVYLAWHKEAFTTAYKLADEFLKISRGGK